MRRTATSDNLPVVEEPSPNEIVEREVFKNVMFTIWGMMKSHKKELLGLCEGMVLVYIGYILAISIDAIAKSYGGLGIISVIALILIILASILMDIFGNLITRSNSLKEGPVVGPNFLIILNEYFLQPSYNLFHSQYELTKNERIQKLIEERKKEHE